MESRDSRESSIGHVNYHIHREVTLYLTGNYWLYLIETSLFVYEIPQQYSQTQDRFRDLVKFQMKMFGMNYCMNDCKS